MQHNIVSVVVDWADMIKDGRTLREVHDSIVEETEELGDEIRFIERNMTPGPDGVFGEAIDILASTLDIIRQVRPDATVEDLTNEIAEYLNRKCHKWATKYSDYKGDYVPLKK